MMASNNIETKINQLSFGEEPAQPIHVIPNNPLRLHVDGSANPNPGPITIGLSLFKNNSLIWNKTINGGHGTNNESEFIAVIKAIELLIQLNQSIEELKNLPCTIVSDSRLTVNAITNNRKPKASNLKKLYDKYIETKSRIELPIELIWLPRNYNSSADESSKGTFLSQVLEAKGLAKS